MGCGASSTRVAADAYAADASPPAEIAADPSSSSAASEPPTAAKPDGVAFTPPPRRLSSTGDARSASRR